MGPWNLVFSPLPGNISPLSGAISRDRGKRTQGRAEGRGPAGRGRQATATRGGRREKVLEGRKHGVLHVLLIS